MADSIVEDLENGESPIPLIELTGQSFMPRRQGKELHRRVPFRWASAGLKGHRLEVIRCGGVGLATTRSATLRFFRALSDPDAATDTITPSQRKRHFEAADARLAAAGI